MVYFIYEEDERDYHELEETTCSCNPAVRFLDSGDMLILHSSFVEPEKVLHEETIESAIAIIMENKI